MKLRFYRFMESVFSLPAAYFGDKADSIDTELHRKLREAMKDINYRELKVSQQITQPDCEKIADK